MKSESLFSMPFSNVNDMLEKLHTAGLDEDLASVLRFNRRAREVVIKFARMFSAHEFDSNSPDKYARFVYGWKELIEKGILSPESFRPLLDEKYVGGDILQNIYYDQTCGLPWKKGILEELFSSGHLFFEMPISPEAIISLMRNWSKVCSLFDCPCQLDLENKEGLLLGLNEGLFRKFLRPRMGVPGWRSISTIVDPDLSGVELNSMYSFDRAFRHDHYYRPASGAEIILRDLIGYLTTKGIWPSETWSCDCYYSGSSSDNESSEHTCWFFRGGMNGSYEIRIVNSESLDEAPLPEQWNLVKSRIPGR